MSKRNALEIYPCGLADELIRVFDDKGLEDEYPSGPLLKYGNGVIVQLFESQQPLDGRAINLVTRRHVVLRGPRYGSSLFPPFVKGLAGNEEFENPIPRTIQIIDTVLLNPSTIDGKWWIIQWPEFKQKKARLLVNRLLVDLGIKKKIQFRHIRRGVWRLVPIGEPKTKSSRHYLLGSKYPWGELEEGISRPIKRIDTRGACSGFASWAALREIKWKIQTRTIKGWGVEVVRLPLSEEDANG